MLITFCGRIPCPTLCTIGMQGEHNAETLTFAGLPVIEDGVATLNVVLPNGTADVLAITDDAVTITRNITLPGPVTGWVTIQKGTEIVWKSERFVMRVGQLPDIDTPIEQQYPSVVEQAVEAIQEAGRLIGGVPAGGTTGQILSKKTGSDYDTEWTDAKGGGLPSGGTTGQVLTKTQDGAAWETIRKVPGIIGNAYSVLFDEWGTLTWEDLAYILSISEDDGEEIIWISDVGDLWNAYYSGRPIRIIDKDGSDNIYTLEGVFVNHSTEPDDEYRLAIRRLKIDGTWDERQFAVTYDGDFGSYIGREIH